MRTAVACLIAVVLACSSAGTSGLRADERRPPDPLGCYEPVADVDPDDDPVAWIARDLTNVACGYGRQYDEVTNPAFLATWGAENVELAGRFPEQIAELLREPTRPRLNPTRIPFAKVADPFRAPDDWEASGRGQTMRFQFTSKTGAKQYARLFAPNPRPDEGRLPGVVFSPGLFSFNEVNLYVAEGLAEAGYIVMTIDPQGQGDSESFSHAPDGSIDCDTDPDCGLNPLDNVAGFESAIDVFLATPRAPSRWARGVNGRGTLSYNPWWARLDRARLGISGHSMGAITATPLGQRDRRVDAIVSFDNLDRPYRPGELTDAHAPTLFVAVDYDFPQPPLPIAPRSAPDPSRRLGPQRQLVAKGVDAMTIVPRASSHYEYGYQPFPASFPASRYGERTSFHFALAWFDRYVKGDRTATTRLTARVYDGSVDGSSIGAGTFDAAAAAADPTNPKAGNVPYRIRGLCVADTLSFYYRSSFWLDGGRLRSADMRRRACR